MTPRSLETALARCALVVLPIAAPIETWLSWPDGLTDPDYLVDVVGIGLLLWGALASLRARPDAAPGVLCAGCAWAASSGWRALALHLDTLQHGGHVDVGLVWLLGGAEIAALISLALLLLLVVESQTPRKRDASGR